MGQTEIFQQLLERYPELTVCREDIWKAYEEWVACFDRGGKLMVCGNGGSGADAQHIVGELMKEFDRMRPLEGAFAAKLEAMYPQDGLSAKLQPALTAMALGVGQVLASAYSNDVAPDMVFAQEVYGYAREGDILLALSTSGNSRNVCNAVKVARAMGLRTIGICGRRYMGEDNVLKGLCDICIVIPETEVYLVQELTLPIYHALCRMVEACYWQPSRHTDGCG